MEWKQGLNVHSASAGTDFAKFRIFWDLRNSRADAIRYEGRIETLYGADLCSRSDLPTMEEARAWCVATYITILQEELARFS